MDDRLIGERNVELFCGHGRRSISFCGGQEKPVVACGLGKQVLRVRVKLRSQGKLLDEINVALVSQCGTT